MRRDILLTNPLNFRLAGISNVRDEQCQHDLIDTTFVNLILCSRSVARMICTLALCESTVCCWQSVFLCWAVANNL